MTRFYRFELTGTEWQIVSRLSIVMSALLASSLLPLSAYAQTRSLSGMLELDTGVASRDYVLQLSVNNHSFIVVPPFSIIRPIISRETVTVIIPAGFRSVDYELNGISTNAVDYSVQVQCADCEGFVPEQYYSPGGNKSGFESSVYLDPEDLPERLDFALITQAIFDGAISLQRSAQRDLSFTVSIVSAQNPNRVYKTGALVTLNQGATDVDYRVEDVSRNIRQDQFQVQLQCNNCFRSSAQPQLFPAALSPLENHRDIDFLVTDDEPITITPLIELLLLD